MILVGIDAGVETTKVVVMQDGRIIGRACTATGGADRPARIQEAFQSALDEAGIRQEEVGTISATGKGKYDVSFAARRVTEIIAAAHGVGFLCPGISAVMSVGADETLVVTLGGERLIEEYVLNQKCTADLGIFLRVMAERLEMPLEQFSRAMTDGAPEINENCVVFAELDALSLLNNGADRQTVAAACNRAAAVRAATVLNDITVFSGGSVALVGGVARNAAFVQALEALLGITFLIPEEAEYAGAIGAAISGVKGISA